MHIVAALTSLFNEVPSWFNAVTGVVSAASAVAALTPTPKDDNFLSGVVRVLDVLALNVGNVKRTGTTPPAAPSKQ
jgi:hypothetical protein